jgi:8-oxo-dGTP diphosphatase
VPGGVPQRTALAYALPVAEVVVGAVIVDASMRAFVHRRGPDRSLFPGAWDVPGGHVEPGETPLARELNEETGWRLARVLAELGETVWVGDDGVARREHDFLVEVDGDTESPQLEHPQHVAFAWVDLDGLDRLIGVGPSPGDALVRDVVARGLAAARAVARGLGQAPT